MNDVAFFIIAVTLAYSRLCQILIESVKVHGAYIRQLQVADSDIDSAKAKTDPDPAISDFYKAYYTKKTQVLEDKISVEEYRTWLETYQE